MPTLSIVVPIYNVERYLPMCLDSLRAQTYRDLEIICVDDGSTDRSSQLIKLYQKVEPRIVVVTKPNGGLSSARNAGLDVATGDYVCFVDSDDLLEKNAAKRIVESFEETQADVLVYGGYCYPATEWDPWTDSVLTTRDAIFDEFTMDILSVEHTNPFAWRTAVRRDWFNKEGVRFDETLKFGEDRVFQFQLYPRARRLVTISDRLYDYRISREGSLMAERGQNLAMKFYEHIRILQRIYQDWAQQGILHKYAEGILLNSADFVLPDIFGMPEYERFLLSTFLESVWTTYFTRDELEVLIKNERFGWMASCVLLNRQEEFGLSYKLNQTKLRLQHGGPAVLVADKLKQVVTSPAFEKAKSLMPPTMRSEDTRQKQILTKVNEIGSLNDSLMLLSAEISASEGESL